MSFDSQFEAAFAPAWGATGAEPMTYTGPGGSPVVTEVPVTYNEDREGLDGGDGYGKMVARKRTGSAFRTRFVEQGVKPEKNGTFTRESGAILKIGQPPEGPDSAGEYRFDFG
jgi:hypothetical protein